MHDDELLFFIALTQIPQIGSIQSRILLEHLGTAAEVFRAKKSLLEKIPGIGTIRADNICQFKDFRSAEKEIQFIEKYRIRPLLYDQDEFPKRLTQCADPPVILYYKGNTDLNVSRVISVVGTRKQTEYGRSLVEQYIEAWRDLGILIVSGLAYGIDQLAHRHSLRVGIPTVGVLASGLDIIYPSSHTSMAREMVLNGGLLTEFTSGTQPDKQNFPRRNRIVAGMCDAVLVVETDVKGGSMITAEIAAGYDREVFAIPGKINDKKSAGCNSLIRDNKARLTLDPADLIEFMNWDLEKKPPRQQVILPELDENATTLLKVLQHEGALHIDRLYALSGLKRSIFHSAVLGLELSGLVTQIPGNFYALRL
ncbi:MAG TPA: DNA-processing protein DprA [Chitinophagaceae bacterium]|nr:DNA-processing protein DprA [Chitinophagaceae bacterium]